jgi:hypothetical protein
MPPEQRADRLSVFIDLRGTANLKCPLCGEYGIHEIRGDFRASKEKGMVYLSLYEPDKEKQQQRRQTPQPPQTQATPQSNEPPPHDDGDVPF